MNKIKSFFWQVVIFLAIFFLSLWVFTKIPIYDGSHIEDKNINIQREKGSKDTLWVK